MTASKQTRSISSVQRGALPHRPVAARVQSAADRDDADLEFRVDLSDVPVPPMALAVDGLKPTLLSRVLGLFQR